MNEWHTDGNGVAGLLSEVLAVEPTTIERVCEGCGDAYPLGAHRAYHGAGVVLRCPGCEMVAVRIAKLGERVVVSWSGTYRM